MALGHKEAQAGLKNYWLVITSPLTIYTSGLVNLKTGKVTQVTTIEMYTAIYNCMFRSCKFLSWRLVQVEGYNIGDVT